MSYGPAEADDYCRFGFLTGSGMPDASAAGSDGEETSPSPSLAPDDEADAFADFWALDVLAFAVFDVGIGVTSSV